MELSNSVKSGFIAAGILVSTQAYADIGHEEEFVKDPQPGWVYANKAEFVKKGWGTGNTDVSQAVGPPYTTQGFDTSVSLGEGGILDVHFIGPNCSDGTFKPDLIVGEYLYKEYIGLKAEFERLPGTLISLGTFVRKENETEMEVDFDFHPEVKKFFKDSERGRVTRIQIQDLEKDISPMPYKGPDIDYVALRACPGV